MICWNCKTDNEPTAQKLGVNYAKCDYCASIYTTDDITSVLVTENDQPEARNWYWNSKERMTRLNAAFGTPISTALDFGCGTGDFVTFLIENGVLTAGIDKNTSITLANVTGNYDAITIVEVVEHLTNPREILQTLADKLNPGGILYIETTFSDYLPTILDASYIDPSIGHINVLSLQALTEMSPSGTAGPHIINPNVIYFKRLK